MPYVINQECLGEQYADCVDVCPVNCIYPGDYKGEKFMVIDPDVCIDCGACLPECPVEAIVASVDDAPEWGKVNAELTPLFKNNPAVTPRPPQDPPKKKHPNPGLKP
jgi:ferredoxin